MSQAKRTRRTNVAILVETLSEMTNQRASSKKLAAALGWDVEKTRKWAAVAVADPRTAVEVGRGDLFIYTGSERSASVGLYSSVASVLGGEKWSRETLRRKDVEVTTTAKSGRRGSGSWVHPDLVMTCNPLRRSDRLAPPEIHAIEVENYKGFGIDSLYQAHSQGRGANFAWVIAPHESIEKPGLSDRLEWIHTQTGVGLITFRKISAPSTFKVLLPAIEFLPDQRNRLQFLAVVLRQDENSPLHGGQEYWQGINRSRRAFSPRRVP